MKDIGQTIEHKVEHGAHEAAAVLYNASSFVAYPRQSGHDDHGVHGPEIQAPDTPQIDNDMERGGRGR